MTIAKPYANEAALCACFIAEVAKLGTWDAYPETEGWDILLSRKTDGLQIGIEAKLKLNSLVVEQALEHRYCCLSPGPDHRAVLVPENGGSFSEKLCAYLGITILRIRRYERWTGIGDREASEIYPMLPGDKGGRWHSSDQWHELCPATRHKLPEYVPDSVAGIPSPITLTNWKIAAIKIAVLLETRPVTRADFNLLGIDHRRWLPSVAGWLQLAPGGFGWIAGAGIPDFRRQHPRNYEEIKADAPKWMPPAPPLTKQALLPLVRQGEVA